MLDRRGVSRSELLQGFERGEVEVAVAPLQDAHGLEVVRLQSLDRVGIERLRRAGDAERPVVHVAAGAARDLAELGRRQVAVVVAVELARGRKRDVIDVEIETHADGIGGDQEVDVARLVERDLRVARARRQCAEHDGRAAALASDQLGDRIDLCRGERDDGGALGQASDLLLAPRR